MITDEISSAFYSIKQISRIYFEYRRLGARSVAENVLRIFATNESTVLLRTPENRRMAHGNRQRSPLTRRTYGNEVHSKFRFLPISNFRRHDPNPKQGVPWRKVAEVLFALCLQSQEGRLVRCGAAGPRRTGRHTTTERLRLKGEVGRPRNEDRDEDRLHNTTNLYTPRGPILMITRSYPYN